MAEVVGEIALSAIGIESFTIFSIGATSVSLSPVVGSAILIGGAIGAQLLLNRPHAPGELPGEAAVPPPESGHQALRQSMGSRVVGLGTVRLGGIYVLYEQSGGVSYDVIVFHHGKIRALRQIYLHDDVVTLTGGVVDELGDGRYGGGSVTIGIAAGADPETAHSGIVSALPSIWTSAHRGDGLASLAMICNGTTLAAFTTIYPRGKPEPSVVCDATPIWDWRDPAQLENDDTTWLASANPVLQLVWYLTDADRGMGLDWDVLIEPVLDELTAQADLCDALVAKADGSTEKRYTSNGFYALDGDHADVLKTIADTGDIWFAENGDGTLALKVGVYEAPTVPIESKHVKGWSIQKGTADEEAVNELTINYTESFLDYKTVPGQPWRDEDNISTVGKVRSQGLALPWVNSHAQARRLAKRKMAQLNSAVRGTLTCTLYGIRFIGERWIPVQLPECADLADVVIENRGMSVDWMNAEVTFNFIIINPNEIDAWDPETEEGLSPTIAEKLVSPPPPVPQNLAAVARGSVGPGEPLLSCSIDNPGRSDLQYQIAFRLNGSVGAFTNDIQVSGTLAAGRVTFLAGFVSSGMSPGNTYEIKARAFAPAGPGSAFSSPTVIVSI